MSLSRAGSKLTRVTPEGVGRTRGGVRQMQLQGQHAADPGWRAAKGAGPGALWGAPCFHAGDAATEDPGTALPPRCTGEVRLEVSAALAGRDLPDWTLPWPGSASGRGSHRAQEICFARASPKQKFMSFLPNLLLLFRMFSNR